MKKHSAFLSLLSLCCTLVFSPFLRAQAPTRGQAVVTGHVPYRFHHVRIEAGGFITGIVFQPAVHGLAYLRTDIGGAYRWNGATGDWTSLSEWLPAPQSNLIGIESLAIDPAHPDDLYLAAGTYTHPGVPNGALLRSHDRGAHFQIVPLPFQLGGNEPGRFAGERLALDPSHPGVLYLGTRNNGLWRSNDHGSTWKPMTSFPGKSSNGMGVVFVVFGPKESDGAAAGTQPMYVGVSTLSGPNLYLSRDGGEHWSPLAGAPSGTLPYHAAFAADGTLYATYGNAPGPNDVSQGAVWRRDRDGHWQQITPEPPSSNPRGFAYAGLALDPAHPGTVLVSTLDRWQPGDTIFASRDGGRHWTSLTDQAVRDASASPYLIHAGKLPFGHWIGAIAIDPFNDQHVFYGTGETLWTTHDLDQAWLQRPTHWTVGADGIEETAVISLLSPSAGAPLFMGLGDIGCFRADSVAPGVEATALQPPSLSNCDAIAAAAQQPEIMAMVGRVWTGAHHGGISTDGGHTWQPFASEPAGSAGGGSMAITADGGLLLWTTQAGIFISDDQGQRWQTLSKCDSGERRRMQVVADPRDSHRLYLLNPFSRRVSELQFNPTFPAKAISSGAHSELQQAASGTCTLSPAAADKALQDDVPAGSRLIADPQGDRLWLFGPDGLFSIEPASGVRNEVAVNAKISAFAVGKPLVRRGPETLYLAGSIGQESGVFRSVDDGKSWQHIDDAEHAYGYIAPMAADPRVPGRIYLGTNGLGVIVAKP